MNLYIRFFWNIFINLILNRSIKITDEAILKMRVLPTDLDLNMHMNNGRYLTVMDIARTDLLVRSGLHKVVAKHKLSGVTGGIHITFLKELSLFKKYSVHSKGIYWDDMWFYIEQKFMKDGHIAANAIAKVTFLQKGKRVSPTQVIEWLDPSVEKMALPKFLEELIDGESDMIEEVRSHNRKLKKN